VANWLKCREHAPSRHGDWPDGRFWERGQGLAACNSSFLGTIGIQLSAHLLRTNELDQRPELAAI